MHLKKKKKKEKETVACVKGEGSGCGYSCFGSRNPKAGPNLFNRTGKWDRGSRINVVGRQEVVVVGNP
jgi:hypothetical protein